MRSRSLILFAAVLAGALASPALCAQELQYDTKALDPSGATTTPKAKKGRQAKPAQTPAAAVKSTKPGGDRQFGELEGWSPGKAPPKEKDQDGGPATPGKGPVSVSPTGNLGVGLPF